MKYRTALAARLLLCVVFGSGIPFPGATASEPDRANPEDGTFADGVYANSYFGLRYPLPAGWTAGLRPPRPSSTGYYVLDTPAPPVDARATILVAAQDEFFADKPIADAKGLVRDLARSLSGPDHAAAEATTAKIAGHAFSRLDIHGTPLSRIVLATEIRCHVVIFTFTGVDPEQLKGLAASLDRLSLAAVSAAPVCLEGYATTRTIRRRIEPVLTGPRYVSIPVRIIIGDDGRVEHVHVIRAVVDQQRSIEDALPQWQFAPYLADGRPAQVETGITFEFKPTRGGG